MATPPPTAPGPGSSSPGGGAPPRRLGEVPPLAYVTAENAANYRAIVEVFVQAKEHYAIELRPAEVRDRLARSGLAHGLSDEAALDRHLDQLDEWGNLQRAHDTSAVARVEDFYRRRYLYRLTPAGEAAHQAVREVEAAVGRSGSLQTSMLLEIRDALTAVAAGARAGDGAAVVRALHRLRTSFESLTAEANLFLGELDRHAAAERVDLARFVAYKHALLAYLGRFVEDLRRLRPEVAERLAEAEAIGAAAFLELAAGAAELPPALDGADPQARWLAEERDRWDGVRAWFAGAAGAGPRVERLQAAARAAVVRLARALERLNERRTRPVDRAADFRTLARWFAACGDDAEAHALWASAFGLHPPRHFTLEDDDPDVVLPGESWWEARPVEVPVRLRTHGAVVRSGRPPPALDFSDGRAWLAAVRRRVRGEADAALARFAGRGPQQLSAIVALSPAELAEMLALLDEALVARQGPDGARRALTSDGRHELELVPPPDASAWAALETPDGRLVCPDFTLEVRAAGGVKRAAGAEGA